MTAPVKPPVEERTVACLDLTSGFPAGKSPAGRRPAGEHPAGQPPAGKRPPGRGMRWLSAALICCGAGMVPWLAVLAVWLPATTKAFHWPIAWVGLDGLEGAGLFLTGWLARRHDPRRGLAAAGTAVLLTVDAWFDVTTSAPGNSLVVAVAMAAAAELPLAAVCAVLALRSLSEESPDAADK